MGKRADTQPTPLGHFSEHEDLVRIVAGRFFVDENDIDDVVQETWIVGHQRSRESIRNPRAWFAEIARRVSLGICSVRMRSRWQEASLDDLWEPDDGPPEQVEEVLSSLELLREPYRTAVRLRFCEGLDVRAIAQLQGVPAETVRTRIKRGIHMLRQRLSKGEKNHGWGLGLLAKGFWREVLGVRVLAGAAGTVLTFLVALHLWDSAAAGVEGVPRGADSTGTAGVSEDALEWNAQGGWGVVEGRTSTAQTSSPSGVAERSSLGRRLSGVVASPSGAPVEGARVIVFASREGVTECKALSDEDGRFEVALPRGAAYVWVESGDLVSPERFHASPAFRGAAEARFPLTQAGSVVGRVVDGTGQPVSGALVSPVDAVGFRRRRAAGFPGASWIPNNAGPATSGFTGEFRLEGVTQVPLQVLIEHSAFSGDRIVIDRWEGSELILKRPSRLFLDIVAPGGGRVAGAQLAISPRSESRGIRLSQGAEGWVLEGMAPGSLEYLRVAAPGFASMLSCVRAPEVGSDRLRLELEMPQSLLGAVIDAGGQPIAGAAVAVYDAGPLARESSAANRLGVLHSLGCLGRASTDSMGNFQLAGLPTRELSLRVSLNDGSETVLVRPAWPGSKVRIDLGRDAQGIPCRITDALSGQGVAGADITLVDDFRGDRMWQVQSDKEGRFNLPPAITDTGQVLVYAEGYAPEILSVARLSRAGQLALGPPKNMQIRVKDRLGQPLRAGFVRLLDGVGEPVLSGLGNGHYSDLLTIGLDGIVRIESSSGRLAELEILPPQLGALEEHPLPREFVGGQGSLVLGNYECVEQERELTIKFARVADLAEGVEIKIIAGNGRVAHQVSLVLEEGRIRMTGPPSGWLASPRSRVPLRVSGNSRGLLSALRGLRVSDVDPEVSLFIPEDALSLEVTFGSGVGLERSLPAGRAAIVVVLSGHSD